MPIVTKYFFNKSHAMQGLIKDLHMRQQAGLDASNALCQEIGAERAHFFLRGDGAFAGFKFDGKAPNGFKKTREGMHFPRADRLPEIHRRANALHCPRADSILPPEFAKFYGVHEGTFIYFPTLQICRDGTRKEIYRGMAQVTMYAGKPPRGDMNKAMFESTLIVPQGWQEWKRWQYERYICDYNERGGGERE